MKRKNVVGAALLILCAAVAAGYVLFTPAPSDPNKQNVASKKPPRTGYPSSAQTGKIAKTDSSVTGESFQEQKRLFQFSSIAEYERKSQFGRLPKALQGTRIDGKLKVDDKGNLMIDHDMRALFDYFLVAANEEGPDIAVKRIEEYIRLTLPHPASEKAAAILQAYLDYNRSQKRFEPASGPSTDKKAFLTELRKAVSDRMDRRREYLEPDVVTAFFGEEEAYDAFTLRRLDVESDESLSLVEKEEKINQLEEQLPEAKKESRRRFRQELALQNQIQELQKIQGNEDQIHELHAGFYGREAADRLAGLDQKRSDFSRRIDSYRERKEKIMNTSALDHQEKQARIEALESKTFTETELREVRIRERIQEQRVHKETNG